MPSRDTRNERLIAGTLLLLGFLLLFPAVIINAPGMGENSDIGRTFPFLFDPPWQIYWSVAFLVVTLFGLAIFEGVLRQQGDRVFARLGMVTFMLATTMWLVGVPLDDNGVRGGRDFEGLFVVLAFSAVFMYGLAILRTSVLPRWIGIAVMVWTALLLIRVIPHNEGPLFYEPALILIAFALLLTSVPRTLNEEQGQGRSP